MKWPRRTITTLALLAVPSLHAADEDPGQALAREIKKLVDVYSAVEEQSADPINPESLLYQGAIPGMLRTLDPHSVFFDPDQFEQLQRMENSEQKGFGTVVNVLPGRVIVLQALPGSPSSKAGLGAGDEILAVNNIPLSQLDFDQIIALLSEARQKQAVLHVRHPGNDHVEQLILSPAVVSTPSVDRAFEIQPRIGYVRITAFETQTARLVKQSVEDLGGEYLRGLILDLRDNPGGDVQAALETAALFLSPDQVVFSSAGRNKEREEVRVSKLASPYTFPVAVLVNGHSASASEIVSGALQDHDRATILGEPTYGKGLVQRVYPLSSMTGLALTTAFYYTPSGRSIQKPLLGVQLNKATTVPQGPYKTDSGRLVRGGGGIQPDEVVLPEAQSRLRLVLDASGVITEFAGTYLKTHPVTEDLEITSGMLDEMKVFLSARNIQPALGEWLSNREWISNRLKQELLNLKFGVAKGDVVGMQQDPVVRAALRRIGAAQ